MSHRLDYRTERAVRSHAVEFRKQHDALDWEASVDDLIELSGYEQGWYEPSRSEDWLEEVVSGSKKQVKALVSVKKKVILVSTDLHQARTPFAKSHELGHAQLPWHQKILYACDEHDLSLATQAQLEFEANAFASELLLPEELLKPYYNNFPPTMETVLLLKKKARASIETTAYAYVRYYPRPCALLVCKVTYDDAGDQTLTVTNKALSDSAARTDLGRIKRGQVLPADHVVVNGALREPTPTVCEAHIGKKTEVKYTTSILNNTYKVFCLMTEKTGDSLA